MTFDQLNPGQCAAALLLLAIGVALMLIAQRRDWRPWLPLAIYTALVLRLVMLALAWRTQPYDLVSDFKTAGWDVLHHQDPVLYTRQNGWGSLPVYAFVLAGALWASVHLHVSWLIIARIPAILSNLGVVVLVGVLAGAAPGHHLGDGLVRDRRKQLLAEPEEVQVGGVAEVEELEVVVPQLERQVHQPVVAGKQVQRAARAAALGNDQNVLAIGQRREADLLELVDERADLGHPGGVQ